MAIVGKDMATKSFS
jgi:hypothetical protein